MSEENPQSNGSKMPGWVLWIGALIVINVLSQVFHWGFIFY
jgi:hypothetical protein